MSAPVPEDDVEIPLRLQPVIPPARGWRGRSNSLVAVGLVGFIVVGIVLGTAFDDGGPASTAAAVASPAPASSSAPPSRSPTPTRVPLATPLPTLEIVGGQIPDERRLVYANGLQLLDLATGTLDPPPPQSPYNDQLMPLSDDQLVCACVLLPGALIGGSTVKDPILRFARFDLTGAPILERDVATFDGATPVPEMTDGFNVVASLDADQRYLFVSAVVRRPPVWTVELYVVDVESGKLVSTAVIDRLPVDLEEPGPSASPGPGRGPPDGVYVWASMLAIAPDGGTIYAAINRSEVRSETWTNSSREWMIPVHDGTLSTPAPLPPEVSLAPDAWCLGRPTFIDQERLVQVCTPTAGGAPGSSYYVRRLTTAGTSIGDVAIPSGQPLDGYMVTPVVDRARRAVFVWDPFRHTMTRIGIDDGPIIGGTVPGSMLPGDRNLSGRGYLGVEPGLTVSPDGRRVYALGIGPGAGQTSRSTGVWVFDSMTLAMIDHWEPRAVLTSLAVSADGRFVYATGAPGYDAAGHENGRWPASVTVYDAASGEIQVVYGAVARDTWVSFAIWQ